VTPISETHAVGLSIRLTNVSKEISDSGSHRTGESQAP
jgi:hypothetical protein